MPDPAWRGPNWPQIIADLLTYAKQHERDPFKRALEIYQGKYWNDGVTGDKTIAVTRTSYNLVFAITESAVSSMVPPNLKWSVAAEAERPAWCAPKLEQTVNREARKRSWREEAVISMTDAVLFGRSILKTMPILEGGKGKGATCKGVSVRALAPGTVLFDLSTRRPQDLKFFVELCVMTPEELLEQEGHGKPYRLPPTLLSGGKLQRLRDYARGYPAWVSRAAADSNKDGRFLMIWEVWDNERKEMTKWIDGVTDAPIFHLKMGKEYVCPYTLYNLNYNGENCLGLSEVQLCLDNIEAINRFLSWILTIVRRAVPVTGYDAAQVDEESVVRMATAMPGDYVAVKGAGKGSGIDPKTAFWSAPVPETPKELPDLMGKLESIVQYTSALADAARGQVSGARTATELALIESQQRTRLGLRTSRFQQAWARVGLLALWYLGGRKGDIGELAGDVELITYNGTESTRMVLREQFQTLYNFMGARNQAAAAAGEPAPFDVHELDEMFVQAWGLPSAVLASTEPNKGAGAVDGDVARAALGLLHQVAQQLAPLEAAAAQLPPEIAAPLGTVSGLLEELATTLMQSMGAAPEASADREEPEPEEELEEAPETEEPPIESPTDPQLAGGIGV